ncbi:MAG TPA: ABC transporter permease [Woeseiaceae bacterium]|nr:ABC transporter permease [Woeseiaceae bacterium]
MSLRSIKAGLRALFRREEVYRELDDELAHYLEEAARENIRAGMSPARAWRAARMQMGSVASAREEALSGGWEAGLESLFRDVRYGVRTLRRNPGFAAAAIVTLALGIGVNTAMFSVVNAVMLRPLPWRDAGKLAIIWTDDARRGLHQEGTAYRTVTDWRSANRTFQDIGYYSTQRVALMTNEPAGERGRSRSAFVSANLFSVLGVAPARGRTISTVDETERAAVAVVSHALWQRWFAGAPGIIGKTLVVDDGSKSGLGTLTVVGVMPAGFYFPDRQTEIWTPATTYWRFERESVERFPSWARRWTAVGRLAPGASIDDARSDLAGIGRQLAATHVSNVPDFPGFGTTIMPALDFITGQKLQSALWILFGAVSLVLLVACVNVANLLLARGAARQQEFALRRALGAGRIRVARQLVIESLLLSLAGGTVGTLTAAWGTKALATAASGFVPRIDGVTTDWRVLGFALLASVVAGLAFGLAPALRLSSRDAGEALKGGGRSVGRVRLRRSRDLLVIAECALALTLLTGAGLLLRSLERLQSVDPGFDPSNVLTLRMEFPSEPPPTVEERMQTSRVEPSRARARAAVANQLIERVRMLPGVAAVGIIDDLFLSGQGNESITIPGRSGEELVSGELNEGSLTPGFFPALRVPLRRGRLITDDDAEQKIRALWSPIAPRMSLEDEERVATAEPVVVNEAFVRRFFANEEPIGKRFNIDPTNKTYWYEIVGVVGDMHRQGLDRVSIPEYFGPWIPSPNGRADLLVRTSGDPLALAASARQEVQRMVPGVTVVSVTTAGAQLGGFSALRRLQTWLLAIFALLALTLAGIGIFGLVHFTVAERTREIGVRVALGASPPEVMGLVLGQGMRTVAIGIAVGLATALALTRVLASLLFEVGATDLGTFTAVALVLASVAAGACWIAGRRALRVDPVRALREV